MKNTRTAKKTRTKPVATKVRAARRRTKDREHAKVVKPTALVKAGVVLPGGILARRANVVDAKLRKLADGIGQMMFAFAGLTREVESRDLYKALHFQDMDSYLARHGVSYRATRRWQSLHEAVEAVPKAEQPALRDVLLKQVRVHRAAVLVPWIKEKPGEWREAVREAIKRDERALQAYVSEKLGLKPRGRTSVDGETTPGQKALDTLIGLMPEGERDAMRELYEAGTVAVDEDGYKGKDRTAIVLMHILWDARPGIEQLAREKGWMPKAERESASA